MELDCDPECEMTINSVVSWIEALPKWTESRNECFQLIVKTIVIGTQIRGACKMY